MLAHNEQPVTSTSDIEVGIMGARLDPDGPATGIWEHARPGKHILAYDLSRLTEGLAIQWARVLFGDSIRIVTMAGA